MRDIRPLVDLKLGKAGTFSASAVYSKANKVGCLGRKFYYRRPAVGIQGTNRYGGPVAKC